MDLRCRSHASASRRATRVLPIPEAWSTSAGEELNRSTAQRPAAPTQSQPAAQEASSALGVAGVGWALLVAARTLGRRLNERSVLALRPPKSHANAAAPCGGAFCRFRASIQ